jgi:putative transposase
MAEKFQNKYRVPSARAVWWDYSQPGAYFVTICTHDRVHSFGEIIRRDDACIVSTTQIGKYAQQYWNQIPDHFPSVELGAFQVMPNHIHGILIIGDGVVVETMHASSLQDPEFMKSISPKTGSLARIVGSYKSAVSKSAHSINLNFQWQERYYDHIIRDEGEFNRIQDYIINNPKNWAEDRFF